VHSSGSERAAAFRIRVQAAAPTGLLATESPPVLSPNLERPDVAVGANVFHPPAASLHAIALDEACLAHRRYQPA
jgi:hypothetical protein